MSKMIYVPQYPTEMRYQEWWIDEFKKVFESEFDEVVVLGEKVITDIYEITESGLFSPIRASVEFESLQISEYLDLEIDNDDYLFLSDISFPGIFPQILFHKKPKNCFAYCHATSKNKYDYFTEVKKPKFQVETGLSRLFDCILIGSAYHQEKIKWTNTMVVCLPDPPVINYVKSEKDKDIVSVARPTVQKINKKWEKRAAEKFGPIIRPEDVTSWYKYSKFLSESKVLLITTKEDTFNYTVLDAIKCGCIPIAPNNLAFPEILPRRYLYNDYNELEKKLEWALNGASVPEILCKDKVDNFFTNVISIMKRGCLDVL